MPVPAFSWTESALSLQARPHAPAGGNEPPKRQPLDREANNREVIDCYFLKTTENNIARPR